MTRFKECKSAFEFGRANARACSIATFCLKLLFRRSCFHRFVMVEKLQGSSADDRNGSTGAKSTPESFRSHVAAGVLNQTATARQSAHSYAGSPQVHHATASHVLKGEVRDLVSSVVLHYMQCNNSVSG